MIGHLDGRVLELQPGLVVLEAGGVGYEVHLPISAHPFLAGRERAALFVHTHVREDQLALYGFPTRRERDTFRLLLSVSGVGPRTALALLSGLTPDELATAVESEQWRRLAAAPGIGKRTAERLIVELKGKLEATARETASPRQDAVSALVNLGYPPRAAEEAVGDLLRSGAEMGLDELLRRALQTLGR
ncbi:MAG: Holliday junction branch migration protein RuvA [Thermoanaerobaculaceae bacterium]|nr:Holliday junction branch migration protein RuvA [Thermoanaerobaculaceae bacterium]TAM51825.1 MAG: Holliday junction branch migration protein RuvA [Acidobacteriota bacterium]